MVKRILKKHIRYISSDQSSNLKHKNKVVLRVKGKKVIRNNNWGKVRIGGRLIDLKDLL